MDTNPAKSGNTARNEEFVRLLSLNQGRVFTYIATLLPCRADAEEVLQHTSIVLWQKFDQFDASASFVNWAYGVAYREALKHLRQQSRRRQAFREAVLEKLTRTHIARSDLLEDRRLAMNDCVDRLSASDRDIIEHYYYQGRKTAADVGRELGRPTNTILHALVRIRGGLQHCIDEKVSSENRR